MSQTESASNVAAGAAATQPETDKITNQFNNTDINASGTASDVCVKEDRIEMKASKGKDPHALDLQTLGKASVIPVFSEKGDSVEFGTLFKAQKTIVVFIRHFLCGLCQAYVEELGKIPKEALDAAGTRIVVIGCGDWPVIETYRENTHNYPYEIYAEPTRKLHRTLGLGSSMKAPSGPKKSYVPNILGSVFASLKQGLSQLSLVTKVGNFAQLGGEFVLGPGSEITYSYRMQNSQDHTEVEDLMKAAVVAWPAGTAVAKQGHETK